jgi:hypothetical protein
MIVESIGEIEMENQDEIKEMKISKLSKRKMFSKMMK